VLDETGPVERCQIEGTLPMLEKNDKGVDQTATSAADAVAPPKYGNCRVRHGACRPADTWTAAGRNPPQGPWSLKKE
jgi:hypothetical protein